MPSIHDQLLSKVRSYLVDVIGIDESRVVPANDSGLRPAFPYVTIQIGTSQVSVATTEDLDAGLVGHMSATVQLDTYGRGGHQILHAANVQLEAKGVRTWLLENNLSMRFAGGATDLSALVDETIEQRFSQDAQIYYTTLDPVAVAAIEAHQVSFDINGDTFEEALTELESYLVLGAFDTSSETIYDTADWSL